MGENCKKKNQYRFKNDEKTKKVKDIKLHKIFSYSF